MVCSNSECTKMSNENMAGKDINEVVTHRNDLKTICVIGGCR